MTAIELVLLNGDHCRDRHSLVDFRLNSTTEVDPEASRRFLVRILSRAILDVCMYDEEDVRHVSAKDWLLGHVDAYISFVEIAELVGLDFLQSQIFTLAEQEGIHRDKVRDMKKLLYNYDGSTGQSN